ncbi:hypothetical protein [Tateyamaria sp. syn59]|uniref:hypothetical protein n=1 Tax=Tateyamaria sp. syn59 TaxID=2576942 RepID=UPI0011BD9916|nr:hypothetical protein [Tateyamaria sp. syn59]
MRAPAAFFCLTLAACTQFPDLDDAVSPDVAASDFPALVPLEPLIAGAQPIVGDPVATTENLETRIADLRARASALQRRPVVDPATRARMQNRMR